MNRAARLLAAVLVGAAAGNLPAAEAAARAASGADLRREGTRNPGAMNVTHVLGRKWGTAVFVLDVGKGSMAARLGHRLAGPAGANVGCARCGGGPLLPGRSSRRQGAWPPRSVR